MPACNCLLLLHFINFKDLFKYSKQGESETEIALRFAVCKSRDDDPVNSEHNGNPCVEPEAYQLALCLRSGISQGFYDISSNTL
jgi:hypothetical protein